MDERLLIRVDAGREWGAGHIVRCIALAQMLKNRFTFEFYARSVPSQFGDDIERHGWKLVTLENEHDFVKNINQRQVVVLDGYHFDTEYQIRIKEKGAILVCIDDLYDKEFFADLIINYTPGARTDQYQAQPYTKFAVGSDYTLLRPGFIEKASLKRSVEKLESVFICFGGNDANDFTTRSLNQIINFPEFRKIVVVTGPTYENRSGVAAFLRSDDRITHFHAITEGEMIQVMKETEVAIVPASSILLEAIAVGNIPLICYNAGNQKYFHDYLKRECNVLSFDFEPNTLSSQLRVLLNGKQETSLGALRNSISNSPSKILEVINNVSA